MEDRILSLWTYIWKDPDAGKDWRQQEKETTEDEMAGWHHRLDAHEFEQTLGDSDGQKKPGVMHFMGSQRVRHDWMTELNWLKGKNPMLISIDAGKIFDKILVLSW